MPYRLPVVLRPKDRRLIIIDLPDSEELSLSGQAENLVDPTPSLDWEGDHDRVGIKLTVCRSLRAPHQREMKRGGA